MKDYEMTHINNMFKVTSIDSDYIVEITKENQMIEFWLYKKDYGIKEFMVGIEDNGQMINDMFELIDANIEDWITLYQEEHEE